jgi:hypothetical protein
MPKSAVTTDDVEAMFDEAHLARRKSFRAEPVMDELSGLLLVPDGRRDVAQSEHQGREFIEVDGGLERSRVRRADLMRAG